ncbi:hypothetical protein [Staphylococcus sp. HMSC06C11]|uniref:hypothetical protein n=1 Tax=Staphylococcus sp. HMSC06C11 TaxID=1581122 RepID=UPI002109D2BC|nr:hypothetical protein [Staphylococcus sp. HMSC06C11]
MSFTLDAISSLACGFFRTSTLMLSIVCVAFVLALSTSLFDVERLIYCIPSLSA